MKPSFKHSTVTKPRCGSKERTGDGTVQDESETSPRGVAGSPGAAKKRREGSRPAGAPGARRWTTSSKVREVRASASNAEVATKSRCADRGRANPSSSRTVDDVPRSMRITAVPSSSQSGDSKPRLLTGICRMELAYLERSVIASVAVVSIQTSRPQRSAEGADKTQKR